jgi:multiple sugar transport system permease protein/cellobiose transport system permease protein
LAYQYVGFLIEMRTIGWSNTHLPLIVSAMISPYGVFLITQFAKDGFPDEIKESARIDGAGELSTSSGFSCLLHALPV